MIVPPPEAEGLSFYDFMREFLGLRVGAGVE